MRSACRSRSAFRRRVRHLAVGVVLLGCTAGLILLWAPRGGAEQRPWTKVARERLPRRLKEKRDQIRDEVSLRREKAQAREGKGLFRW